MPPAPSSKFSDALAKLKQPPTESPADSARAPAAAPLPTEPGRGRGRPPGKRSDPDYQPTTLLLRKETKKTASRLVEDGGAAHDLSDLVEQLLTVWIAQQSA